MQPKFKAALIVGGVLLILNLGTGVLCQLCPFALSLIAGVVVGWLTIRWTPVKPANPPADGAIAGGLAALGGFVGQLISLVLNVVVFASMGFVNPLTGEQLSTGQEQGVAIASGIGIWACGGLVAVLVTAGVAALVAMLVANNKTYPEAPGTPPDVYR
jgi:hypothetical protein